MVFEGNIKESIFEQTTFYYQKDIPRNINKILTPKINAFASKDIKGLYFIVF
jgi:hypothetical protein